MVASVGVEVLENELQSNYFDNNEDHPSNRTLTILNDIKTSCGNVMEIVNEMLTFHKVENRIFNIEFEDISTFSLFELSVKSFEQQVSRS